MLVLELFLKGSSSGKNNLERVVIEMNKDEARAFVGKLREIEKVRTHICTISMII
jgi:hypothetical protein